VREVFVFHPPRQKGMIFHGVLVLCLAATGTFSIWKASLAISGPTFLTYLLIALISLAFLPNLIYRMIALQRAKYTLGRDGISLYWGLRREEIPIDKVSWVKAANQAQIPHVRPFLRLPGAVLGVRALSGGKPIEYLASRNSQLVMIATPLRIYAISPSDQSEFLNTYRKLAEFGSLTPIKSASEYPTSLLSRVWADFTARLLLIISALMVVGLIIWVSISIPNHPMSALRLNADGLPVELIPGIRLLLLPVLNTFFYIVDLLSGLFFFQRKETRALGYLMWTSSALTTLLFSVAVYYILQVT
jgi:hypothetical protein